MVLLTDGKHPYLLCINSKCSSSYLSPYKLRPIISDEVIETDIHTIFGNKVIRWHNQYPSIIEVNTDYRDKLEHAINLNMFKH